MWKIKYFRLCTLGLCTLLLWYGSVVCREKMEWFADSVSLRWENGTGVSPEQMSRVLEKQKKAGGTMPSFVLWTSGYAQVLCGDFYPVPVKGEVFEYYGDISGLQAGRFQYGYWPGDEKGCVIDEGIAHALWGSSDVLGRTVKWDGKTWYVCGVIEGMGGLALFPAEETDHMPFQGLWLDLSEEQGGVYAAEQILQRYQLPAGVMTDLGLYVWFSEMLAALPAFLLWVWTLAAAARRLWRLRYTWVLFLVSAPMMSAGVAVTSRMVGFPWSVPARFLPTRWSDGSFWGSLCAQAGDGILAAARMPLAAWERTFWITFFLCLLLSVLTVLLLRPAVRLLPVPAPKNILRISLLWWIGLLCVIWKDKDSPAGNPSIILWMLPTAWMTIRWLLNLHARFLCGEISRGSMAAAVCKPEDRKNYCGCGYELPESGGYLDQGGKEHVVMEEKTKI